MKSRLSLSFGKIILTSIPALIAIFAFGLSSCSDSEPEVRHQDDIIGYWTDGKGRYMNLESETVAYNLYVYDQDGLTIGRYEQDGYFYEPGYNLVLYMDESLNPQVYKIVELSDKEMIWCWVEDIRESFDNNDSVGEIIGQIIKDAQEGFDLDPANYLYFYSITEDEYLDIVDSLDVIEPW